MKNILNNISRPGMRLGVTTMTALCIGLLSVSAKPSHGGGGSGGGGGSTGSFPYPTASTVSQLAADINYANKFGGTYTIYLQSNTTFTNGFSIGGTTSVNLTIIGNGDTLDGGNQSRLFVVNAGSSLNLNQVTLRNGYVYANYGGAIYNSGMLTISNCIISGNTSVDRSDYLSSLRGVGGAIYNNAGTVIIDNSMLFNNVATGANPMGGAIYNAPLYLGSATVGTVIISNSTFTNNVAAGPGGYTDPEYPPSGEGGAFFNEAGTATISHSSLTDNYATYAGGAICNGFAYYSSGTVTVENSTQVSGNTVDDVQNSGALYLDGTSSIGILNGNSAIAIP